VLTPERAVKHEHGASTGQIGKHDRSNRYVRPLPPELANFLPGGTALGKKHPGLI
jgi:hypothetical protein